MQLDAVFANSWTDILALVWFLTLFNGYMIYAKKRSYQVTCLSSVLHLYRTEWMREMLIRDNRVADTNAVANLERGGTFFASTTMLVIAGLITLLSRSDTALDLLSELQIVNPLTRLEWDLRIVVMIVLFIYAFFKFTWSLRQYGFVSVMIGGAPQFTKNDDPRLIEINANRVAKMSSMAAANFNVGLRTYYFSIAVLGWMINAWVFMICTMIVVWVLYRREFNSSTLKTLMMSTEIPSSTTKG